jgi:sugar phosphate isomerase/epimerase
MIIRGISVIIGTNFPIRSEYSTRLEDRIAAGNDPFAAFETAELDYVELALTDEHGLDADALQADIDELHRRGMVVNMHPYYHCRGFGTDAEIPTLRDNLQEALRIAHQTAQHEGRTITLNFHAAAGGTDTFTRAQYLAQSTAFFGWLMEVADKLDVIITAEHQLPPKPGTNYVRIGDSFTELMRLKTDIPHEKFHICWDVGHSTMKTAHYGDDLHPPAEFLPLVGHVHIHDVDMSTPNDHRPISSADAPLADYVAALLGAGYDGSFTMEYAANEFFGPLYADFLRESRANLLKLIAVSDHASH